MVMYVAFERGWTCASRAARHRWTTRGFLESSTISSRLRAHDPLHRYLFEPEIREGSVDFKLARAFSKSRIGRLQRRQRSRQLRVLVIFSRACVWTQHEKATRHSSTRGDTLNPFRTMTVKQMHAMTPVMRDAAACASLPLKCPSPVTLEAMHIARQCGVLTDLEVGSAGDGRDPSRRVSGALVGSVLQYDEEKENIDPVTGAHARLASGMAAGVNARGASRLSSNRAIATCRFSPRARFQDSN